MCDHVCATCQNYLNSKQCRSYEQERKFQWLCNSGCHTCKCCRQEKSACLFFLLRFCTLIHSQCSSRKTEDHKNKFSGKISCCISTEMCNICRVSKLSKENILAALYHLSCNFHCTTDSSLPEWHIKYMMKTKWNQSTFNKSKNQCSNITGSCYKTAQSVDSVLNYRPYKIQKNSHKHIDDRGNDRNETGTSKE